MPVKIFATANCDDVVVFWRIDSPLPDCWGFAVERERKNDDGSVARTVLDNRVGFTADHPQAGDKRPSTEWPFQRFSWADHDVDTGDKVRYRVTPMIHDGTHLTQNLNERSAWTPWLDVSSDAGAGVGVSFNRALVISQFMARYLERLRVDEGLATLKDALKRFKDTIGDHELPIRKYLAGELREELLALLAGARNKQQQVFGALYELDDDELIAELAKFGKRGHLVLANGSIKKKKGETSAEARKRDENKAARKLLRDKKLEICDRMISPGALGHNKFLVITNGAVKPKALAVWTGSTNWTKTGLCTQTNNGLLVRNDDFAAKYLEQWELLKESKSTFPKKLLTANSQPHRATLSSGKADIWFTRSPKSVDLTAIDEIVNGAKEAILFLMFQPGGAATLGSIRKRIATPGSLYVKGVVSTLPPEHVDDETEVVVDTVGDAQKHRVDLDIVQPQGIKTPFASWAATVTRNEFLTMQGGVIGFAIVHSKVIVVDPFTKPVVITGSHNFSSSASKKNDENFVIMRGNQDMAMEYAVHILSVYKHYRWLAYVDRMQRDKKKPFSSLAETPDWQKGHLKGASKNEIDFWVR
jgi:phosphatidylserine/phosphatidylglycerophosphate/cardiolipin synthase-like enzyme